MCQSSPTITSDTNRAVLLQQLSIPTTLVTCEGCDNLGGPVVTRSASLRHAFRALLTDGAQEVRFERVTAD